jgi:hypothetical protein
VRCVRHVVGINPTYVVRWRRSERQMPYPVCRYGWHHQPMSTTKDDDDDDANSGSGCG